MARIQIVYVISFTRAAAELRARLANFCANQPYAGAAENVRVSTMHALALSMLRAAAVLNTLS
jgi:superfamily I DNA/RNA helicase